MYLGKKKSCSNIASSPEYHIDWPVLLSCLSVVIHVWCPAVLLLCRLAGLLSGCPAGLLLCRPAGLLSCCSAVLVVCWSSVQLLWCPAGLMSCWSGVMQVTCSWSAVLVVCWSSVLLLWCPASWSACQLHAYIMYMTIYAFQLMQGIMNSNNNNYAQWHMNMTQTENTQGKDKS